MADVEMTDAGAAPKVKTSKAGPSGGEAGDKKRFEVKKVCIHLTEREGDGACAMLTMNSGMP